MKKLKLERLKNSEKIGTTSIKSQNIFDKEKEKKYKQNIFIKSLICILLTNIFTYMSVKERNIETNQDQMINLSDFSKVTMSLTNYSPIKDSPTKVTILDAHNRRIISEAYIISEEGNDSYSEEQKRYILAIKRNEIPSIAKIKNKKLFSYPYYKSTKTKQVTSKGAPYEISI